MRHRKARRASSSLAARDGRRARPTTDRFFREMVDSMRNGVIAVTRRGDVVVMNDLAYHILGLEQRRNDLGRLFRDVLAEQPDIVRILASAFELSHLPNRAELRLKHTGQVIGYTLSLVRDDHDRATGAALFFKDLTQVEQLEERERLRDRLAALGEMAAAIAHELKNPLGGIEVMAGLLRRKIGDVPEVQALIRDIIGEAKMANSIVEELLAYVRPIQLRVEEVQIAPLLQEALAHAGTKAAPGDVAVQICLKREVRVLHADPHQLRQLFTNLITNAFEAMNGRGVLSISVDRAPQSRGRSRELSASIEVADTGPGLPANIVEKIFNPFFTTKPTGSGLGLAIVRKIVDAHDGRIDVESAPGRGTKFRVTLPLMPPSAETEHG